MDLSILENSKNVVYTLDLDGKTTYINPAFMRLLEVSDPTELINKLFLPKQFWSNPKDRNRFLRELYGFLLFQLFPFSFFLHY